VQRLRLARAEQQLEQPCLAMKDRDRVPGFVQVGGRFAADQAAADYGPARPLGAVECSFPAAAQREQVVEAVESHEFRTRRGESPGNTRSGTRRKDEYFVVQRATVLEAQASLRAVPHKRIRYTDRFDDPNLPGEMHVTVPMKKVQVGTELSIVQEGVPDVIPPEACYLGWQESLAQLAKLVEAEIPD